MTRAKTLPTLALCAAIAIGTFFASPLPAAMTVTDPMGVVKIGPGEPITIAWWLAVSGPAAALGTDARRGIEIAVDDAHAALLGHPIRLIGEDSGCTPEGGQAAAAGIAANRAAVVAIGSSCANEAVPGAPILWKAGIATVSPSNTAPVLTDPARGSNFDGYLRVAYNDRVQGRVIATFARKVLNVGKAATIDDGSPYAEALANAFAEGFKKQGGTITSREAIAPGDTEMHPVLTRIASGKPELIYYPIFIAEGGLITRQAKEVPGLANVTLAGADGLLTPDFLKAAGDTATGMYLSSPDLTPDALAPDYVKVFIPKYKAKYRQLPIAGFHAYAYDATNVVLTAIQKVARSDGGTLYIGRRALRDALYATKNFKGLTGTLTCNQHGDCADPHIAVYQILSANPAAWDPGKNPKKVFPIGKP